MDKLDPYAYEKLPMRLTPENDPSAVMNPIPPFNIHAEPLSVRAQVAAPKGLPDPLLLRTNCVFNQNGQYFICYDFPQTLATPLELVSISFTDPDFTTESTLLIEVLLYNKDPKTSRGTVTTISHSAI